jgi:hypothetical protein
MKSALEDSRVIEKLAPEMGGVFSNIDLRTLFNQDSPVLFHRRIRLFEEHNILRRFKKGIYVTPEYNAEMLAGRIYPGSYISMGSALAKEMYIGSIPAKTVYSVKTGRNRIFSGPDVTLSYFGISPRLVFGVHSEKGIRYAVAEKAFLDTLYYFQKGRKFSFDIFSDIDISRLDKSLIISWLDRYKNPRFKTFAQGVLSGGNL